MKAVVVEDSRIARQGLIRQLKEFTQIEVLADAENVDEARILIEETRPDLIFLDINMPEKNGFELLGLLSYSPKIIFTTAYTEYAIRSFDFNTVDYLLKPISPERLSKAIDKLFSPKAPIEEPLAEHSKIYLKDKETSYLITLCDISQIESCGNHSRIHCREAKPFILKSLSKIEQRLPNSIFFRANRQVLVNLKHIQSIQDDTHGSCLAILSDGEQVKVSRSNSQRLKNLFAL